MNKIKKLVIKKQIAALIKDNRGGKDDHTNDMAKILTSLGIIGIIAAAIIVGFQTDIYPTMMQMFHDIIPSA